MQTTPIRLLIVEDFEPFRRLLISMLQKEWNLQIVGEVSDGVEAVQKAKELEPDLVLLDIGLPRLNGMEAARQIRIASPHSKILFLSQNYSIDLPNEAAKIGASGYVLKSDAGGELLPAIRAVLAGKWFVSSSFGDSPLDGPADPPSGASFGPQDLATLTPTPACQHEAVFYTDEASFLDGFTQFIAASLNSGNAVIVVATESHRDALLSRLHHLGLEIGSIIQQGRYIAVDAAETLSTFMKNGLPDPVLFSQVARDLVLAASQAVGGAPCRTSVCGEGAPILWAQGNAQAAIQLEQLWDDVARTYSLNILCGYRAAISQTRLDDEDHKHICEAHSSAYSRISVGQ